MPRYARSFGDVALDREIDRLWQFHDALEKRLDEILAMVRALQAKAGSGSTGNVIGATGGSSGPGNGSGSVTPDPTDPTSTSASGTDPTTTSRMASPAVGWSGGGVVATTDAVVLHGDVTLTGDLLVLGNLIVKDIPSGAALTIQAVAPAFGVLYSTIELPPPA